MKGSARKTMACLSTVLMFGLAVPACSADPTQPAMSGNPSPMAEGTFPSFERIDANHDGYLSLEEFRNAGLDDLAFKAADSDTDQRVQRGEYAKYVKVKEEDKAKLGAEMPGTAGAARTPPPGAATPK